MGDFNAAADTWRPEYDEDAARLNTSLDGTDVKLPGYIVPLELGARA